MKYIGLAVFLLALNWTWGLSLTDAKDTLAVNTEIQSGLSDMIREMVKDRWPEVATISFDRLWTEPMDDGTIRAVYRFRIRNPEKGDVEEEFGGTLKLKQQSEDTWVIDKVRSTSARTAVVFHSGLLVHAGKSVTQ